MKITVPAMIFSVLLVAVPQSAVAMQKEPFSLNGPTQLLTGWTLVLSYLSTQAYLKLLPKEILREAASYLSAEDLFEALAPAGLFRSEAIRLLEESNAHLTLTLSESTMAQLLKLDASDTLQLIREIRSHDLTEQDCRKLMRFLNRHAAQLTHLESLHFSGSAFGRTGMLLFTGAAPRLTHLQTVELWECALGANGVRNLVVALKDLAALQILDVRGIPVDSEDTRYFVDLANHFSGRDIEIFLSNYDDDV